MGFVVRGCLVRGWGVGMCSWYGELVELGLCLWGFPGFGLPFFFTGFTAFIASAACTAVLSAE